MYDKHMLKYCFTRWAFLLNRQTLTVNYITELRAIVPLATVSLMIKEL
jgi:hypothetical protein